MITEKNWLWDRKTSLEKAKKILREPGHSSFLSLSSILLSRKNYPEEIFKAYLKPGVFLLNWSRIKRQMRKDSWNNPRIEYWQAIYEKLKEKYQKRGMAPEKQISAARPEDDFCKSIAVKIKTIRKLKKLTQKGLAKKLNISQQMISRIEKGRENISLLTLKKIVDSLGADIHLEISEKKS